MEIVFSCKPKFTDGSAKEVMAATEPAKEEEAPAEAPAAVGCQAPSVAPEAEAAPATENKTVEIAKMESLMRRCLGADGGAPTPP